MTIGGWGLFESLKKNVLSDKVKPVVGSVLKCDLMLNMASHTGIYLGNDRIAEVTEINGRARVRAVSPDEFLDGDSDSIARTGAFIYVAACDGEALGSAEIARRARAWLNRSRGEYGVTDNNCHKFTAYCITGIEPDDAIWSEDEIAELVADAFGVDSVEWSSTGLGCGDYSFDDVDYDSDDEEDDEEDEEEEDWDVDSDDDDEYIEVGSRSDTFKSTAARRSGKMSIQQLFGGKKTVRKIPSKRAPAKKRPALKAVPTKRAAPKAKRRVVSKALPARKAMPVKKAAPAKRAPKVKKRALSKALPAKKAMPAKKAAPAKRAAPKAKRPRD